MSRRWTRVLMLVGPLWVIAASLAPAATAQAAENTDDGLECFETDDGTVLCTHGPDCIDPVTGQLSACTGPMATSTTTTLMDATSTPPPAVVSSPAGAVEGHLVASCWSTPAGPGAIEHLCRDGPVPQPSELPLLSTPEGATLSVRFDTSASPLELQLAATGDDGVEQRLEAAAANPTNVSVGLAPGVYVVSLFSRWGPGDAIYFLRLQVDATRQPSSTSPGDTVRWEEQRQLPATGGDAGVPASAGAAMAVIGTLLLAARLRVTEP